MKTVQQRKIRGSISVPREPLVNLSMTRTQATQLRDLLTNAAATAHTNADQVSFTLAIELYDVIGGLLK